MVSNKKFNFKRILAIIIAVILLFSAVSLAVTKIVYDGIFVRYDCEITDYPEELSEMISKRETKGFVSGKNTLSGYLYRSQATVTHDTLIILAPGFNACADSYLWQIKSLLDYGWSVFAFNTTGCCTSEGDSSIGFPQAVYDIKAALKCVEIVDRFGYNNIVLLGHSRGGYAACCALDFDYNIAAVVSISGINSAMEGVIGSSAEYVGPLAYGNYGFLWSYQAMLFGTKTLNLDAAKEISESNVPVLIVHGENDSQVPLDRYSIISHKKEITSKNVEYVICSDPESSGHTDLLFKEDGTANDDLMKQINSFLERAVK